MTREKAERLLSLVCDQYGTHSARLITLGRGDQYAVMVKGCFICWSFDDWTAFRADAKAKARAERKRSYLHGISAEESYTLHLPALV